MTSKHYSSTKNRFSFPAILTPDPDDGGYVVTFRDLPEAITQGDSVEEALQEAADCLDEAIAARIDDNLDIPYPSDIEQENEYLVSLPIQITLKAAINLAMRESDITQAQLASKLKAHEREVRRILDPHHGTKVAKMEQTLKVLGKKTELCVI